MIDLEDIKRPVWSLNKEDVISLLQGSSNGITDEDAIERLAAFGNNTIKITGRSTAISIFLNQLKSPLIIILIFAGIITLFLKDYKDSVFIFLAVFVNSALGFYQENKAETALANLRTYIRERVRVIRGGRDLEIDAESVVPGDLIKLSPGMRIPADSRLLNVNGLSIDESILTGESLPVTDKTPEPSKESAQITDQNSMVFAGTLVNEGLGLAIAVRTGVKTEIGRIAEMVALEPAEATPLQKAISKFTLKSSLFLGALTVLLFIVGINTGHEAYDMFLISVAVAVAAVPEGLPIALTVILAIGVERLAKKNGIVRKLLAAETLGSTTMILTDKTGTLTEAKMKVSEVWGPKSEEEILKLGLINVDVIIENPDEDSSKWKIIGGALDSALVMGSAERGIRWDVIKKSIEVLDKRPFNSKDKFAATEIKVGNQTSFWSYLGAPEILLDKLKMDEDKKYEIAQKIDALAFSGKRVLSVTGNGEFYGLIAFSDPVRSGVKAAIAEVAGAGIRTIIITGDHKGTALSVANECGISATLSEVISGEELRSMTDDELKARLGSVKIFARVLPEDKSRIASLLKKMGEIVAMTGDGVNDAPALKAADIGIAVGSGTDVAKGAADLVILDNNFETIVRAVEEGRRTLDNIKKVIVYLFSNVFDGLILIGGSILMGIPIPFTAAQILWVNFFLDSFPGISLGFENGKNHLKDKRRKLGENLMDPGMKFLIFTIGILSSLVLFGMYVVLLRSGLDFDLVRTFIFASFSLYTLFFIFSIKNLKESIFRYNIFSNKYLNWSVVMGFVFTIAAIYLPILQDLLGTVSLPLIWFVWVFVFGIFNIVAVEIGKWMLRRYLN